MLDQNERAVIGDNNPPDPIETVIAEYDATISEAHNWAGGDPVTDEKSMLAVDAVIKEFKTYKTALGKAGKERTDPLHKAWKAGVAAVKVYTDDADQLQSTLVATVAPFKAKLAAEKEAERRAAWQAAENARIAAEEAAANANAASIDEQREAEAARQAALDAQKSALAAQKDTVKGMRTVTKFAIEDHKDALHDIARNDRDAVTAFIEEYVRRNHKTREILGVKVWTEKEAY